MDLPHPYHRFKFPQTVQICAQENKPKPAQGAADGKVTRVWPQRAEVWQAQSLTHLCKGKPSRDQGVSISPEVNKLFRLLKTLPLLLASGTVLHFCKEDKVKIGHLENQEGSDVLKKDIVHDNFYAEPIFRRVCPSWEWIIHTNMSSQMWLLIN